MTWNPKESAGPVVLLSMIRDGVARRLQGARTSVRPPMTVQMERVELVSVGDDDELRALAEVRFAHRGVRSTLEREGRSDHDQHARVHIGNGIVGVLHDKRAEHPGIDAPGPVIAQAAVVMVVPVTRRSGFHRPVGSQ